MAQQDNTRQAFPRGNTVKSVVSCHANACGATILFSRASGIGATKRAI